MPRDTLTAPLILPLACTSEGSRTSRISTSPRPISARASAGGTRATAALASASNSLTLDGIEIVLRIRRRAHRTDGAVAGPAVSGRKRSLARVKRRVDRVGPGLLRLVMMVDAPRRRTMARASVGGAAVMVRGLVIARGRRYIGR